MKRFFPIDFLPWLAVGFGGIGLLLRLWLFSSGIDGKGLFITGHPANILLWVLSLVTVAWIFLCLQQRLPHVKYSSLFRPSRTAAIGCWVGSLSILIFALSDREVLQAMQAAGTLHAAVIGSAVMGVVAAASLVYLGICRWKGIHPAPVFRAAVCIFFMVHLICQYRNWSGEPELQNFFFQLLASLSLMLSAYGRTALDTGKPVKMPYLLFQQTAIFFCCLSGKGPHGFLYLGMALWCLLDCPSLLSPDRAWRDA